METLIYPWYEVVHGEGVEHLASAAFATSISRAPLPGVRSFLHESWLAGRHPAFSITSTSSVEIRHHSEAYQSYDRPGSRVDFRKAAHAIEVTRSAYTQAHDPLVDPSGDHPGALAGRFLGGRVPDDKTSPRSLRRTCSKRRMGPHRGSAAADTRWSGDRRLVR